MRLEYSEDKEALYPDKRSGTRDESPMTPPGQDFQDSNWNPVIPDKVFKNRAPQDGMSEAPTSSHEPPLQPSSAASKSLASFSDRSLGDSGIPVAASDAMLAREAHNVSPKAKREFLFVQEHPDHLSALSSSPEMPTALPGNLYDDPTSATMLDFSQKSREWIEGYQAGLQRKPVGMDRMGKFLDGYCSGLLKSSSSADVSSNDEEQRSSIEIKSSGDNPESFLDTQSQRREINEKAAPNRPQLLETMVSSMDTLKEAVFAPQNENAVLSPAVDGPHVGDQPPNLGGWAKGKANMDTGCAGFPFPERASSKLRQQVKASDQHDIQHSPQQKSLVNVSGNVANKGNPVDVHQESIRADMPDKYGASSPVNTHRITSLTSLDSKLSRKLTSHQIISPQHE
jgi:hypothetical protein